ncbi:MAG: efflux RND transporter periplasmic adaptor subunit [Planctomycetota bacterium]|nr:efflux RND transporter periplasmic adaptor subunit [Planctomycetota bacterium]
MDESIRFRVNAYPDRVFEGRVFSTGSVVDDKTRTLPMTAIAENPQRLLKPGMFVEVELRGEPLTDVLAVPVSAIQEHENKRFVFVHLEGDEFVRRDVSTGRAGGDMVEVTAGLADDEAVVVEGRVLLEIADARRAVRGRGLNWPWSSVSSICRSTTDSPSFC